MFVNNFTEKLMKRLFQFWRHKQTKQTNKKIAILLNPSFFWRLIVILLSQHLNSISFSFLHCIHQQKKRVWCSVWLTHTDNPECGDWTTEEHHLELFHSCEWKCVQERCLLQWQQQKCEKERKKLKLQQNKGEKKEKSTKQSSVQRLCPGTSWYKNHHHHTTWSVYCSTGPILIGIGPRPNVVVLTTPNLDQDLDPAVF